MHADAGKVDVMVDAHLVRDVQARGLGETVYMRWRL